MSSKTYCSYLIAEKEHNGEQMMMGLLALHDAVENVEPGSESDEGILEVLRRIFRKKNIQKEIYRCIDFLGRESQVTRRKILVTKAVEKLREKLTDAKTKLKVVEFGPGSKPLEDAVRKQLSQEVREGCVHILCARV